MMGIPISMITNVQVAVVDVQRGIQVQADVVSYFGDDVGVDSAVLLST